jgi:hypothetical protein
MTTNIHAENEMYEVKRAVVVDVKGNGWLLTLRVSFVVSAVLSTVDAMYLYSD